MVKKKKKYVSTRKVLKIPPEYFEAISYGSEIFPILYQFENGLRLATHKHLTTCYGSNWWEEKLRTELSTIYEYVENQKNRKSYMPWLGDSSVTTPLPIHSITLGQIEEVIKKYKSECIPTLFPTIEFFLGHMEIIKRVRNLFSHMYPCISKHDIVVAKREIKTLCDHLATKI
ncbi:MAG: hypothetical protein ACHQQQ_12045 [Bacteroidota bacterium]